MKLKFGMIGGGNCGFIGNIHRLGAEMDNLAVLTAGCFTRDMDKNLQTAKEWGVEDSSRVYASFSEMAEKESRREDGIDFVSIVTPNDSHYTIAKTFLEHGIHVMCDKPLALNTAEAEKLNILADEKGLQLGVTYTYSGYPMIRQAREMIDNREIGNIVTVMAEYPQEWIAVSLVTDKPEQAGWRHDPKRSGASGCAADIGTHVEYLISAMTGLKLNRVLARLENIPSHLPLETNVQVMLEFENKISGMMWTSQVAIGHECDVMVRIFGDKGAIEWTHTQPGILKVTKLNEPVQYYSANRTFLHQPSRILSRMPSGHPDGFIEAFGNLYRGYCKSLLAKKTGGSLGSYRYPTGRDGLHGNRFVEACLKSNAEGNIWVLL